ncbi:MAG: hypothetical protein JO153_18335 [Solirubrobacterales bacterium]|nr:hypothetical protein [Solirubrobacterales bacterium]
MALGRLRVQFDRAIMGFDLALMRRFCLGVGRLRRFLLRREDPLASQLRPLVFPFSTCARFRRTLLRPFDTSIVAGLRHLGSANASATRPLAEQALRLAASLPTRLEADRGRRDPCHRHRHQV